MFMSEKTVARIKSTYPAGTRICLDHMGDDPRPVPDNSCGTVTVVDDIGTVFVKFDNGRHMGLIQTVDSFHKIG